jgi:hypothetical protein
LHQNKYIVVQALQLSIVCSLSEGTDLADRWLMDLFDNGATLYHGYRASRNVTMHTETAPWGKLFTPGIVFYTHSRKLLSKHAPPGPGILMGIICYGFMALFWKERSSGEVDCANVTDTL